MKHLIRYNEELKFDERLYKYCIDAFAELIDDGLVTINKQNIYGDVEVFIEVGKLYNEVGGTFRLCSFNTLLKKERQYIEVLEDVNVAFNRLKDEFDNLITVINDKNDIQIRIGLELTKKI